VGALVGYGCLAVFLVLVGMQVYRWFRDGDWTHVGLGDGLRFSLEHCCVRDGADGAIATFLAWLNSPASWLGLHQVIEFIPASFALFAVSIAGNGLFIYCRDRLRMR
jgi:hypothetical protein